MQTRVKGLLDKLLFSKNVTIQVTTLLSQHEAGSRMTMSPLSGTTITQVEIEGIIKM